MAREKFTSASGTGSPKKKSQLGAGRQVAAGGELHQNVDGQHVGRAIQIKAPIILIQFLP
jgi:hypothetical protein